MKAVATQAAVHADKVDRDDLSLIDLAVFVLGYLLEAAAVGLIAAPGSKTAPLKCAGAG